MKKMTIDQVAELAFVSRSVVSRVLNDHPNVSDEARGRVLRVIEEHDYRPSSVARSLATDRTFEIGVLTPRRRGAALANGFWSLLHSGIFEQCIERGYFVSLSMISPEMSHDVSDRILNDRRLDGYILLTQEVSNQVADALREREVPTVLVGYDPACPTEWPSVDVDNFDGAYQATEHLHCLGHRRIAAILGRLDMRESEDRRDGYRQALEAAGVPVEERRMAIGDYSQQGGFDIMSRWIEEGLEATAVFCASDMMAMGALLALRRAGVAVPEEVALVGFDDLPVVRYIDPPLTTVHQPIYEKGECAANLLIDRIEEKDTSGERVTLKPELVVRESCGASNAKRET